MDKKATDKIIKSLENKYNKEGRISYDDINAELKLDSPDPEQIEYILNDNKGQKPMHM